MNASIERCVARLDQADRDDRNIAEVRLARVRDKIAGRCRRIGMVGLSLVPVFSDAFIHDRR